MIIYRPQRGLLSESMKSAIEFKTESDMKDYIVNDWGKHFSKDDIIIDDHVIRDDRIGWIDTRYVCVNMFGVEDYIKRYGVSQCIGYCATIYPENKN